MGILRDSFDAVYGYTQGKRAGRKAKESEDLAFSKAQQSLDIKDERFRETAESRRDQRNLRNIGRTRLRGGLDEGQQRATDFAEQASEFQFGQDIDTERDRSNQVIANRGLGSSPAAALLLSNQAASEGRRRDALNLERSRQRAELGARNVDSGIGLLSSAVSRDDARRAEASARQTQEDLQSGFYANRAAAHGRNRDALNAQFQRGIGGLADTAERAVLNQPFFANPEAGPENPDAPAKINAVQRFPWLQAPTTTPPVSPYGFNPYSFPYGFPQQPILPPGLGGSGI